MEQERVCKLVLIGKDLEHAQLREGFDSCVAAPALATKKAAHARAAAEVCEWAREALPSRFAGSDVAVAQNRSKRVGSAPIETILTVRLPKPKEFALPSPLIHVTHDAVVGLMRAWGAMLARCTEVQAWAEHALPTAMAGTPVMVEEVETIHVHEKYETAIHVLSTPPWSMRVLVPLRDVTRDKVERVMALATLCTSYGVPSVK